MIFLFTYKWKEQPAGLILICTILFSIFTLPFSPFSFPVKTAATTTFHSIVLTTWTSMHQRCNYYVTPSCDSITWLIMWLITWLITWCSPDMLQICATASSTCLPGLWRGFQWHFHTLHNREDEDAEEV